MLGNYAWKQSDSILILLEKKSTEIGTVKISSVWPKAKKKAQIRVYVFNGSKWDYMGTLGATKGKMVGQAEAALKKAGISEGDFPSGHKWTHFVDPKGGTSTKKPTAKPTPAHEPAPTGAQVKGQDAEGLPEPPTTPNVEAQSKLNAKYKGAVAFIKTMNQSYPGGLEVPHQISHQFSEFGDDSLDMIANYDLAKEIQIVNQGKEPADAQEMYANWLKSNKGETHDDMAFSYGSDWAGKAWAFAAALSHDVGGGGDTDDEKNYPPDDYIPKGAPHPDDYKKTAVAQMKVQAEKQAKSDSEHEFIFDMMQLTGIGVSPTGTESEGEWEAAFGPGWYDSYAMARDMMNHAEAKNSIQGQGGITPGTEKEALEKYGVDFVQAMFDDDWTHKEIAEMYGKDWTTKVNAIAKALYKNPPPASPVASVKDELKGYIKMHHAITKKGGLEGLSPNDEEAIAGSYGADWKKNFKLGKTLQNFMHSDEGSLYQKAADHPAFAATLASMYGDNWKEKAAEIQHQLTLKKPTSAELNPDPKAPDVAAATPTAPQAPPPAVSVQPPPEPAKKSKPKSKKKTKKKSKVPIPAITNYTAPAAGTPAVELPIPPPSELTLKGSGQFLGGAGQKQIYTDSMGNEFLFKIASKKGSGKADPMRAFGQEAFSSIAKKIKPNHPEIKVAKLGGKVGALYPFLPGAEKLDLAGETPASLTDQERQDVAEEHVIDWMMSQHDSHTKNFLRTEDGRIIGIDKEQGFKYFGDDKLDIDYHPNAKYGENEPFYNTFWKDWSKGEFEFDPKKMAGAIDRAMGISGKEFEDALAPYAASRFPGDHIRQSNFIRKAMNRKNTLKRDFEVFLTGLHAKKHGDVGSFTFAGGWVPESEKDKPYEQTVIVTPEKKIPKKHTPAITHTATTMLSTLPGTSKTEPYTPKGASSPDPSMLTVKTTASAAELQVLLKNMGFGDVKVKVGGNYKMAVVDKATWDAYSKKVPAKTEPAKTIPAVTKKEMVYPNQDIASHSGQATYFPAMRASEPTDANVDMLKSITKDTKLKWMGTRITMDGPDVEQQVGRVYRKKDDQGEYYEVHFKLREPAAKQVGTGTSSQFEFRSGQYDKKTDTQVDTPGSFNRKIDARRFSTEHGEAFFVPPAGGAAFAMQGSVYARIRTGPENIHAGLASLLEEMQPGLSKRVLKEPTEEEREVVKLSAALKAVAPRVADQLDKDEKDGTVERTSEVLRQKLKGKMTKADIDRLGQVEILDNHAGVVQPGRWRELGGTTDPSDPNVRFLMWEVSTPDKVVNMFQGNGPASIHDRGLQGLSIGLGDGASVDTDIRTGAADNITMRVVTKSEDNHQLGQGWGNIRLVFAPDELDRLDPFFHHGDKYGCTNPDDYEYGAAFRGRKTLDADLKKQMKTQSKGELVIRRGIPTDKVVRISCNSEEGTAGRKALIKQMKVAGMNEINGVPIEDFIVVAQTRGEMYEKYVKPAGY